MEVRKISVGYYSRVCVLQFSFANESATREQLKRHLWMTGAGFNCVASAVRKGRRLQIVPSQNARAQQYVVTPRFYAAIESVGCLGRRISRSKCIQSRQGGACSGFSVAKRWGTSHHFCCCTTACIRTTTSWGGRRWLPFAEPVKPDTWGELTI